MPWLRFPAVPPALAAGTDRGRMKRRAGLPKLLQKLLIKVLRLRALDEEPMTMSAAFEAACYGYRMGAGYGDEEEYCYCYGYGSSWAGVLSSIPEEEVDDDSSEKEEEEGAPDVALASVLRKAKSERLVVGPPEDATVVHVEVLL
jgi:hypothetical protein